MSASEDEDKITRAGKNNRSGRHNSQQVIPQITAGHHDE
ncbi:hypothetical protein T06_1247 [Trichinella sp. T6]|nr:hypothetical protein T06_1247 [Trichinella sp. T6]